MAKRHPDPSTRLRTRLRRAGQARDDIPHFATTRDPGSRRQRTARRAVPTLATNRDRKVGTPLRGDRMPVFRPPRLRRGKFSRFLAILRSFWTPERAQIRPRMGTDRLSPFRHPARPLGLSPPKNQAGKPEFHKKTGKGLLFPPCFPDFSCFPAKILVLRLSALPRSHFSRFSAIVRVIFGPF